MNGTWSLRQLTLVLLRPKFNSTLIWHVIFEQDAKRRMFEFSKPAFEGYPDSTRIFYNRMFYVLMLNQVAVQRGLFDVLLCDTEDVYTWVRFAESIPRLKHELIGKIQSFPPFPELPES